MPEFDNHDDQYYDQDGPVNANTPLSQTQPPEPENPDPSGRDSESRKPIHLPAHRDPGLQALFINQPLNTADDLPGSDQYGSASGSPDRASEDTVGCEPTMSSHVAAVQPIDTPAVSRSTSAPRPGRPAEFNNPESVAIGSIIHNVGHVSTTGADAQQIRDANGQIREDPIDLVARPRVDSAQHSSAEMSPPKRAPQTPQRSPLKLETISPRQALPDVVSVSESIRTSPVLGTRMLPADTNTLPAVHSMSPVRTAAATSPQSLPSFSQLTGHINQLNEQSHLKELAEAATQEARAPVSSTSHHHSQSFGSATSQSPVLPPFYSQSNASHASPLSVSITGKSPIGDGISYASPQPQQAYHSYYPDRRRSSTAVEHVPSFPPSLPGLHSIPSTSSSGDSRGRAASNADGYSTSHTTPIDTHLPADGTPRPVLPPLHGMSGPFKCDYPDCNHAYQTQYLLSSHKNVHSQNRPHYCPVKDCSRAEGGKGFKRKNEMIRHGLVHSSPGYICPFCPDRNHKYPRPDNLQRHVRVHHVDKDKDDPELREVLAQRAEGTGKARRRRTQGSIGSA